MGRGKIEIKRIENTSNRQVTYSKRRNGIIKKAKEITILCDAKVSLVIYGTSGKMHEYCSPSTNLVDMLDKYQTLSGKKLWDAKHENLSNEIERVRKENENMQIELRHLKGEDITSLNHKELQAFEDALENGLTNIRAKKSEIPKMMSKHGEILEEENRHLQYIVQQSEMAAMEGNMAEMEMNGYHHHHQRMRDQYNDNQQQAPDHDHQLPFSFRVQPIQPNLHERI